MSILLFGALVLQTAKAPHDLDFWIGSWDVFVGAVKDGHDAVEKTLNGFAIHEFWKDADGSKGESFFYYMPRQKRWKQVWMTDVGVYKEKYSEPIPNGMRFTGTVFLPSGRTIRDRTSLTRLPEGRVRQVIESSLDGKNWRVTYDAIYRRSR